MGNSERIHRQLDPSSRLHLSHAPPRMDLYRIFTQLELLGNLLVLASGHCEQ